ncbi:MAG: anthranilate phosphoribosyltransferase [Phycisphaerae bacterium]|nr:anthranilate phosphoribosyltransferase [Phycisphaerae bacterium]MBM91855.1 anthranilate phosphoribosyltransferase [Phycisphaerae bacterium]HCT44871.1 anthranilate phosphoribosyltransferase [Phycisphaerales bacterium]
MPHHADLLELPSVLSSLIASEPLDEAMSERVFLALLNGAFDEAQIGGLLALIQTLPPNAQTLTGAARAMRAHVQRVPYTLKPGETLLDTCGTGGAPKSFNVSTAAAIVAASVTPPEDSSVSRVVVAKHGNRSRTGRGSAEVLQTLGVHVDATPEQQAACLQESGVCFCFAIHHHPAMKHAIGPRRSLGVPTIFNALGPLTNPAGADRQLIGVYSDALVEPMAQALANLGATRAMVVHSTDGLDELSTTAPTRVMHVQAGKLREEMIDAVDLGMPRASLDQLQANSVEHSAEIMLDIFSGNPSPYRDMVSFSAGAAVVVAGVCDDISAGIELAQQAIDTGKTKATLDQLIRVSRDT